MEQKNKNIVILSIKDYNELKNKERILEEEKEELKNEINKDRINFKKSLKKELENLIASGEVYDIDLESKTCSPIFGSRISYISKTRDGVLNKVLDALKITDIVFKDTDISPRKMIINGVEWFSCNADMERAQSWLEKRIIELHKEQNILEETISKLEADKKVLLDKNTLNEPPIEENKLSRSDLIHMLIDRFK